MACTVTICGIKENPAVTEINVRSGPNTGYELLFKAPVGLAGCTVLDVRADDKNSLSKDTSKLYQWFKLRLPDGREGWARDDLLDLDPGDWSAYGYGTLSGKTFAFSLVKGAAAAAQPAPAAPATPAAPAAQPAAPAPAAQPAAPAAPAAGGSAATAVIIMRDGARVRSGPGANQAEVTRLNFGTVASVIELKQEAGGPFRWAHLKSGNVEGWTREDLLHFQGADCERMGLKMDLYPAPMRMGGYWWVRGFEGPQPQHPGWDLGGATGEPLLCGPLGGVVIMAVTASKCTPDKPSVINHGMRIGDPVTFTDPGWGFGYGHFAVVRYTNDQLPASTRAALQAKGFAGAAISVMYAHMSQLTVQQGQALGPNQQVGLCGTTGNSEAPHLHLEIRAHANANETQWSRMAPGLMEPGVLFQR